MWINLKIVPNKYTILKIRDLYCRVHNNHIEVVVGNEILKSQAPSNNAQNMYKENHTNKRRT